MRQGEEGESKGGQRERERERKKERERYNTCLWLNMKQHHMNEDELN